MKTNIRNKKTFAPLCAPAWRFVILLTFLFLTSTCFAQPANDNCASSVLLTSNGACSTGTVVNATNSGIAVAPCTGSAADDVWYRFVTASTDHTIQLSAIGSNLNTSGARFQVFSGTCGSLVSVGCGSGTTALTITTYARNTTYYIRVYSAGAGAITTNGNFTICVTNPAAPTPLIDLGKSFINVSKPTGGTVEPGDILEIRASVVVRGGSFDSCRFTDVVPAGTSYVTGSLKVITNEGKNFQTFTDTRFDAANDEGWITGSAITINMGFNQADQPASVYRRGRIRNNNGHKPSFYGSTCILVASYRITITAAFNNTVNIGGGTITYTTSPPGVTTFTFPASPVMVYDNYGICSNIVGVNSLGTETNGTFGSGNLRNRGASGNVPAGYSYANFTCNAPQDYSYGIANNTGGGVYSTSNNWPKPDGACGGSPTTHRVFTLWDIIGDHTGAANQAAGNTAADTTSGGTGGYMLIVNAAYRIDSAFNHTISGLCANTYYEISCWMRNICSKCGCDSNGTGASGAGYIPTAAGDSSGVRPNLAIALDGVRYYTSGDITYTGQWVKKGFTFRTGPSQTSFTMRFYNNAPGGGGNDWALDDISVVTCSPEMNYGPTHNPIVCDSNSILLTDTVRSYFDNYNYYKWQRSTNGGASWTDVTGVLGPITPTLVNGEWQYIASYTVPPSLTQMSNAGDVYRVVVATTSANLSNVNCRFTDAGPFITLEVINCGIPVATQLLAFSGRLMGDNASLKWTTTGEDEPILFEVEKSSDGINFTVIATVNGYNDYASEQSMYNYVDPTPLASKMFYRIRMKNNAGRSTYSRTIQLNAGKDMLSFISVINPFNELLTFDITNPMTAKAEAHLIDQSGKTVKKLSAEIAEGVNKLVIDNTTLLPGGIYYLRVSVGGSTIQKRVIKQNR